MDFWLRQDDALGSRMYHMKLEDRHVLCWVVPEKNVLNRFSVSFFRKIEGCRTLQVLLMYIIR